MLGKDMVYEQGYFKAILDVISFAEMHSESLKKIKNKKYDLLLNLLRHLAKNKSDMQKFMEYGGDVEIWYSNDYKILKIEKDA